MERKVIAGIVTCNPDIYRLEKNIASISPQVKKIVIIDNQSKNASEIEKKFSQNNKIYFIWNKENLGIAAALNQIGEVSRNEKMDAFLTLDQDSISDPRLVEKLWDALYVNEKVGMACPYVNRKNDFEKSNTVKELEVAITSGSLVLTEVWEKIGRFWEYLFIDEVDHEFCYRLRRYGYKIIQSNEVAIDHIIGEPLKKRIMGHTFCPTNHSAFRRYYISRNAVIMAFLYPDEKKPFENRCEMLFRMIISIIFCEKDKTNKITSIIKGISDGWKWICENKRERN